MNRTTYPSWGNLYQYRKRIAFRFGEIWDIPVKKRYHQILSYYMKDGISILEIGAGERKLERRLKNNWDRVNYKSCDIDESGQHDFSGIDQINGQYDIVCGFEVIEHLSLEEIKNMLIKCFEGMVNEGVLIITTPNIYYPPAYLRDVTHKTPLCYDELGGLVEASGLEVIGIFRLYHDSLIKKILRRYIFYGFFRLMGIDFARQIGLVARKST